MRILILQTLNTRAHQFGHCNFQEAATVLESTLLRYNQYLLLHVYSNIATIQNGFLKCTLWSYKLILKHLLKYCTKFHYIDFVWPLTPSSLMDIWYLVSNKQVICQKIQNESGFNMDNLCYVTQVKSWYMWIVCQVNNFQCTFCKQQTIIMSCHIIFTYHFGDTNFFTHALKKAGVLGTTAIVRFGKYWVRFLTDVLMMCISCIIKIWGFIPTLGSIINIYYIGKCHF